MGTRKEKYVRISYDIVPGMPVYVGNPANKVEAVDSFDDGGSWNTSSVTLFNHNGTHIDAPNHFDREGKRICDYQIEEFIFENPCLVDIRKEKGECITEKELSVAVTQECDILLIRTGFYEKRNEGVYVDDNPWLSPGAARHIRKCFKTIRAVGIDTVSIGSHRHPAEAESAHRILLQRGEFASTPSILIEDLNLGAIKNHIKRLFVIPLFIDGIDSMSCTAFVEVTP